MNTDIFFNSESILTSILLIIAISIFLRLLLFKGRNKLPPGPTGLPIVGYLPFMTRRPYLKILDLHKKFGPIFSLQLGSKYVIVVSDFQSIKEVFTQEVFFSTDPDTPFILNKETVETKAFEGAHWKEQRRFMIHMLRDIGFFKEKMDFHIREEINELLDNLNKQVNKPLIISKFLVPSMSNNISSFIFGKRRSYDDPKRKMLDNLFKELGKKVGETAWQLFFPWTHRLFNFLGFQKGKLLVLNKLKDYFREELAEHEVTLNPDNIRDFIDQYLLEIRKRKEDPNTTFLKPVLLDLVNIIFGAGSETPRITLDWLILMTSLHKDVQRNVHAEIDKVIGRDRFPTKEDRKRMPYTEAAIFETLRWRPVVPLNLLRYTNQDAALGPYFIPRKSYVLVNFWGVSHDPNLWGDDCDQYKPERFLSEDESSLQKPEYYIPFSIGKRVCPGEPLALAEVFLYYVTILQKFQVTAENPHPDLTGEYHFGLEAHPYEIRLQLRNTN